jgi:ABC-type glycerol-3-phosphate transport system permease component
LIFYTRPAGRFLRAPGRGRPDLGRLGAASSIVLIPNVTLFVSLRRQFVQGVASTRLRSRLVAHGTQVFWTG